MPSVEERVETLETVLKEAIRALTAPIYKRRENSVSLKKKCSILRMRCGLLRLKCWPLRTRWWFLRMRRKVNETKSTPKIEYVNEFIEVLKDVYDYFPEHKGKKIIPVFSSLYIPENAE